MRRTAVVGVILVAGLTLSAPAAAALPATPGAGHAPPPVTAAPGAPGVGDPFFPLGGNGGYDVAHYRLKLDWQPEGNVLTASETVLATATQNLSAFDLDLRGFDVRRVTVNTVPAKVSRNGQELTITPARALRKHVPFTVQIEYAGTPEVVTDPDGSIEGWIPTADGAFVVGEPQGSPGWFAVNDTLRDKATYDIAITVPKGLTSVGNGALVSTRTTGGKTTFRWLERYPMAPHLVTITTGKFEVATGRTPRGVPTYVAVDPTQAADAAPVLAKLPSIVDYFSGVFGRYPFETVGAIVDDAPEVGYALETQTKPIFDSAPDESTLAHEIAHQWFGDAVSATQWPDIWLHEGFATWVEWLWAEHTGVQSAHDAFAEQYARAADSSFWKLPPNGLTDPADLFSGAVYNRGAMTLQALREKVGDKKFFTIVQRWYAQHRYGNATTAEFIALSEKISGTDLDAFFTAWLKTPSKPALG